MRPPSSRKPPNVIAYAVITHCTVDSAMFRSFWIDGIATLTIATSRIVMKNAAPTTARTSHLFLCVFGHPPALLSAGSAGGP